MFHDLPVSPGLAPLRKDRLGSAFHPGAGRASMKHGRHTRRSTTAHELFNPLGWQEGVVLNRGCRQLGFVTTSVQSEVDAQASPT